DEVGDLRPRQPEYLDIESELAPFLRNELRGLEFLRVAGLRARDDHDLADAVTGCLGRHQGCGKPGGHKPCEHDEAGEQPEWQPESSPDRTWHRDKSVSNHGAT